MVVEKPSMDEFEEIEGLRSRLEATHTNATREILALTKTKELPKCAGMFQRGKMVQNQPSELLR